MPGQLILVALIVWTGLIAAFSYLTLPDKHLWIPVLLALAGVFSSVLPLAINPNIALVAKAATLILFVLSLERLTPKRRRAIAFGRRAVRLRAPKPLVRGSNNG